MENLILPKEIDALQYLFGNFEKLCFFPCLVSLSKVRLIILNINSIIILYFWRIGKIIIRNIPILLISQMFEKFKLILMTDILLIFRKLPYQ
jgi:hypothetical protein